ncbi:hypothetical protein TSUD_56970 [Trifolium subterraneum]|uniref:Uncharacterized protein n=1 Tax=Trifolium subterraneum TaxID=3900 RepID=A0A2Z6P5Y5_TRISU|nr:hypothetical protein TSUD_56970 [Trifolium subterraneum]
MAGKSNFHANLPILDGKNWDTWVKQMKVIFIVQEADEQVNTVLDPLPANATEQQRTTFREAQKNDNKALFLIHQCVDSKKSYGGDAKVKKVKLQALKRQFELLEMKNDEAVAEYFTRVETLTNHMKNCGSTLSEEEMVEKVLRTLTHKFDYIVVTIEQTKDLSEIKMEDLQSTLEAHELKHGERNHGKEDKQALFVKFKKYQDEKKKWQNKKDSKKGKESVEDKPESSKKEGGQKTKKDKTESMVWYFDTGCSNHMIGNKSILTDFNKCLNTRIKLANGKCGMENVVIQRSNGKKAVIEKVLYVPGMKCNLMSIGQLLEKGFKAVFEGETLKLFDSKQRLILKTTQSQNRTFKTEVKTIEVECLATSTEDKDNDLWHKRYGHLNFKSLSMLNSKNMVLGLPSVIAPVDTCTTCLVGKHPRSSFKSNLPMRSSEVLNVVHSDICGPIDVLSTGGNKYFITFVDEYSSDDDNRSHMTENDNGSDQGPLLMMPTTEDEFGKQEGCIEQLVEKGFTLSLGNNQMKVYNVENKMVFCASLSQSRIVQVKFENSNSEVLIEEESDKSIKILRTYGASKHTSKESDSEHQKVHISKDVIMNEVHINEDSESDCNAETNVEADVEAPEAGVSAVEANVETRAGSTKARELDVEADAEASEAEVSAVEASVETRARSTRTKDWNAETKVEASEVEVNVETEAISTRKRQVPARWQECELADDSRVRKEGKLMQCALLVDEPVTKSKAMTDVGIVSCFLRNKLLITRGLMLHQKKYAEEILRRFNMVESKSAMEMNLKLENQSKEANCRIKVKNHGEDPTIIKKVARCLRYLYKSRPDICLVKGLVSRLKENTRKPHMNNVARRILRYIAGILEFGILLPKSARNAKPEIEIVWFSDADWCGEKVDKKSTSGYVFKFQNALVSWCSKKQLVIALSSCEAEYVAGSLAACQASWLQSLLCEER